MDLPLFVPASINLCVLPQLCVSATAAYQAGNKKPATQGRFLLLLLPGQKLSRFGQRHARESLNGSSPTGSGHRSEPFKKAG